MSKEIVKEQTDEERVQSSINKAIGYLIEDEEEVVKINKRILKLARRLEKTDIAKHITNLHIYRGDKIALCFDDFKKLHAIRVCLRGMFGWWKDNVFSIDSPYGGRAMVRYSAKIETGRPADTSLVKIWFETTIDKIPEGLTNGGKCKFKAETAVKHVFACGTDEGGGA